MKFNFHRDRSERKRDKRSKSRERRRDKDKKERKPEFDIKIKEEPVDGEFEIYLNKLCQQNIEIKNGLKFKTILLLEFAKLTIDIKVMSRNIRTSEGDFKLTSTSSICFKQLIF
jgi:hypothetical protein